MNEKVFRVFISSTFTDLEDIRKEVILGIKKAGHYPVSMEDFPAIATPKDMIMAEISVCDAYVLIVGSKYGSIDSETNLSYTEWEYDYAVEKGLPIYTMMLSNDLIDARIKEGLLTLEDVEISADKYIKFIAKVKNRLVDLVNSSNQVKSMSEAGILQLIRSYGKDMTGLVSGTVLMELEVLKKELKNLQ